MAHETRPIDLIYFGTPEYAVPALKALACDARFNVKLVVTQPDREARRGRRLQLEEPAVKRAATELGLPIYQPARLRTAEERAPLEVEEVDLFVVAAYGIIFGPKALAIPRLGCLNLHASILPRYRGASPISAAILSGDLETGVTLMRMDAGMDTGDIVEVARTPIGVEDTTGSLAERLARIGADLAVDAIPRWVGGVLVATPQPSDGASLVRPLVKADGWIDWRRPAVEIDRLVRAMQPWPRAWTTLPDGVALQVLEAEPDDELQAHPGHVRVRDRAVVVGTGRGRLRLTSVQPAGGRPMDARALAQGRRLADEDRLGVVDSPSQPELPMIRTLD